jgi:hypothetical protein
VGGGGAQGGGGGGVGGGGWGVGGGAQGGARNAVDRFGHAMGYCQALVLFVWGGGGLHLHKNSKCFEQTL